MCFNQKFSVFHKAILAFFALIFLTACGYKDNPFYSPSDKSEHKTERLNKF
ncbi:hypothetical protein [Campylobacter gastrosuis]|uniref:Lipoprotein n=1 Tax=Campylobacter gastrosuis TaxID=2974576 RepID=A0ABT7HR07_9BACT|nr:hypothetical protein [Campylobacter gastrosuis]MDL0089058.1 hypothetical protein [Campylobacter gastrosuis]